jgi:2-polyprenyl-6-methoxyphenol hydroxylase-like FAD-dependent oxidoreductase
VGGVLDIQLPQHLIDDPAMIFFTGASGVFGYSGLTQHDHHKLLFWSVFQTNLPPRDLKHDKAALTSKLKERHAGWTDPIIRQCLAQAAIDTIYPIFIMPDLPHWGRDGCVLIGDAAHALPPRTGQGSSQAFEDALTLALLLNAYLEEHDTSDAVTRTIQGIYHVRHKRTKKLKDKALAFPEPKMPMSNAMKWLLWTVLFVMTKLVYLTSYFAIVDNWNAHKAVSAYLQAESP